MLDKYSIPLKEIAMRSPRLVGEIKKLLTERDDVDLQKEQKGYSLTIGDKLEKRKFNFRTLGEMNNFMLKLKDQDPTLKANPLDAVDKNGLMQRYEDKNFVYKRLKASNDFLLDLKLKDPTLTFPLSTALVEMWQWSPTVTLCSISA